MAYSGGIRTLALDVRKTVDPVLHDRETADGPPVPCVEAADAYDICEQQAEGNPFDDLRVKQGPADIEKDSEHKHGPGPVVKFAVERTCVDTKEAGRQKSGTT